MVRTNADLFDAIIIHDEMCLREVHCYLEMATMYHK